VAEVLANPDPSVGNTLTAPSVATPVRSLIYGTKGSFPYTAPAYSLCVITLSH
jgi:hypothetical protein